MTSKLTREENVQAVFDLKAGYTLGLADVEILKRVARMALAEMGSEPVAYTDEEELNFVNDMACMWTKGMGINEVPLYRHAQQPVVPATLPCSVELKPGLIIGKGCKTETLLTALRRRADYNADIDAMTPEERAEHDASIKAFKAMLAAAPQEVK
ncbi:MAG: hypothetical protein E7L23_28260 [Klebsiella grimontii]|nr:hypothetical protein [Klebsiella grimontii]